MPFTGLAIQLPQVLLRINRVLLCLGSLICSFTPLRFPPLLFCRLAVVAVGPCRIYRVWHLVILVTFFFFWSTSLSLAFWRCQHPFHITSEPRQPQRSWVMFKMHLESFPVGGRAFFPVQTFQGLPLRAASTDEGFQNEQTT